MPPLDPTNTARAFVTYNADTVTHTLMVRINELADDADLSTQIGAVLDTIGDELSLCTFVKFERTAIGSNIRLPAVWTGPTTWGSGDPETDQQANFWSFTGKDSDGHKARVDFFGRHLAPNDDYRLQAADNVHIANTVSALTDASDSFFTIGLGTPIWNSYGNMSFAQHWVKQARK
jgi:hypothetical protein